MALNKTPSRRPIPVGKPVRSAAPADNQHDGDLDESSPPGLHRALHMASSWVASGVFHMTLLVVLALIPLLAAQSASQQLVLSTPEETVDPPDQKLPEIEESVLELPETQFDEPLPAQEEPDDAITPEPDLEPPSGPATQIALGPPIVLGEGGQSTGPGITNGGGTYSGRDEVGRRVAPSGVVVPVQDALKWLAAHQLRDGSWSFDHREGPCQGRCGNHGSLSDAHMGATALGVLPFLGYGQTHKKGKYKDVVRRALTFLVRGMKQNGSLHEPGGTMYSHGLAAIALCEAYAMTGGDRELFAPAQRSLDFISAAQDPVGGGWRYNLKQAGDTSVVGWQIMALKSGQLSSLTIDPRTTRGAAKFLDSVQTESGAFYGYTTPGAGSATTAIGLLCRMYLGWKRDNPALERGVEFLSKTGPSQGNMYYNYYATQVMRHYGGPKWETWDKQMRTYLVSKQAKEGHEAGSWYFGDGADHGAARGGRLYSTSMAAMILEVYYSKQPLYASEDIDTGFPAE
ncbi:MAG: hypothetical protein IID44_13510 [Planctomycetes bacterium]|nr:hypothetical protein [Planctomycetota bacterium]